MIPMDILIAIPSFVVILGIMIFVHELGHFIVARLCRIRVETFSLGFGKKLWGFNRGGTDYRISAIPLGGYLKMAGEYMDEPGHTGAPDEFTSKPRWQRGLVMLAGPLMNFLLAFVLLAANFMIGFYVPAFLKKPPVVGSVLEGSPAAAAGLVMGDEILSLGGKQISSWRELQEQSIYFSRQTAEIVIRHEGQVLKRTMKLREVESDPVESIGILPFTPMKVDSVSPNYPAAHAGLRPGDEIVTVSDGNRTARGYYEIPQLIRTSAAPGGVLDLDGVWVLRCQSIAAAPPFPVMPFPGFDRSPLLPRVPARKLDVEIARGKTVFHVRIVPVVSEEKQTRGLGMIGFGMDTDKVFERYGFIDAACKSWEENIQIVIMTYRVLGRVIAGQLSPKQFTGPLGIAKASAEAVKTLNPVVIFYFIALISTNLAVLNLLPIPVLDGGMLFMLLLEMIIRRDLPLRFKERAIQTGFILLLLFMAIVIFFDIGKFIGKR